MTDFKSFQMDGEVQFRGRDRGMLVFTGIGTHTTGMLTGPVGDGEPLDSRSTCQSTELIPLDSVDPVEFRVTADFLGLSFDVPPYSEIDYPFLECDLCAKEKCNVKCLTIEDKGRHQFCEKGCAGDVGCNASYDTATAANPNPSSAVCEYAS
jgi:hypothetical protein